MTVLGHRAGEIGDSLLMNDASAPPHASIVRWLVMPAVLTAAGAAAAWLHGLAWGVWKLRLGSWEVIGMTLGFASAAGLATGRRLWVRLLVATPAALLCLHGLGSLAWSVRPSSDTGGVVFMERTSRLLFVAFPAAALVIGLHVYEFLREGRRGLPVAAALVVVVMLLAELLATTLDGFPRWNVMAFGGLVGASACLGLEAVRRVSRCR